ncbi:hypothetical protein DH2020_006370 [Rehmannia glutinosa]|uniref:F-box protein n=1 Tax=Rehmannia glutinosa TaxID=99300 RepID=A0ABR0XIT5_REHGL
MECERSVSRRSAEIIAGNEDLLMEIILLLPAKPLIKSQLVCKHWLSIISTPSFSHRHTRLFCRRPKPQQSFILRTIQSQFFYFSPICKVFHPFPFSSPYTRILQSCNGLLLIESRNSKYGQKYYCVYNPITKKSRIVWIERSDKNKKRYISGVSLAFDPKRSIHYKIVCVMATELFQPDYFVDVYDSESHEWTSFGTPFPSDINTIFTNAIYWNNRVYWIRPTSKSFYLDLQTGNVGSAPDIRTPSRKHGEINKNYVMESNDHIHYVSIYLRPHMKYLLVFELLDDNSGWFELYRVSLNPISAAFPEMNVQVGVLGIVRGETEEESSVLLHVPGKVILYKFCDCSFEVVLDLTKSEIYKEDQLQFSRYDVYQFIESLAPV